MAEHVVVIPKLTEAEASLAKRVNAILNRMIDRRFHLVLIGCFAGLVLTAVVQFSSWYDHLHLSTQWILPIMVVGLVLGGVIAHFTFGRYLNARDQRQLEVLKTDPAYASLQRSLQQLVTVDEALNDFDRYVGRLHAQNYPRDTTVQQFLSAS